MENYMMDVSVSRITKIISLNNEIQSLYVKSLPIIKEIGEELHRQKEENSGSFMRWVENNLPFHYDTAINYIKIYLYYDKIGTLPNLQEAYQQIETLEAQERQSKEERERSMISEYRKTGQKPAGWDRSLDYRLKKDDAAFVKQQERIDQERRDREQRAAEYKAKQESDKTYTLHSEAYRLASDTLIKKLDQREEWKEKIRLSDGGKDDAFMDALVDYLETLPNDNRRIEACNNIIKICRNISVQLQRTPVTATA